ncbi:hypothetical protein [Deinococcus aquaticus]|uniref:Uncharacterized protein n=1 Tax=Deinococcus aquaticus TaxID=328692 RepID=A0ABY7V1N9_9DEIO|nr:hypothetical protein [Deinococcus aquaticus]WDA57817.1 hypothetical protein M8445_10695 [Deinococcus aquaticus]
MSLPGLLITGAALFACWMTCQVPGQGRRAPLSSAWGPLLLGVILTLYTHREMRLWSHLPFPYALLGWAAVTFLTLLVGLTLILRGHLSGWPWLGFGLAVLGAAALALLQNAVSSGDPILGSPFISGGRHG